jgi:Recombinase
MSRSTKILGKTTNTLVPRCAPHRSLSSLSDRIIGLSNCRDGASGHRLLPLWSSSGQPNVRSCRLKAPQISPSIDAHLRDCNAHRMAKKLKACPSWLSVSEDKESLVFLPDRAEVLRKIFELSLSGLGCYTIAKQLNDQGVPAFGPSGRWDESTVHNILTNRATIGEHQPKQYRDNKEYPVGDPKCSPKSKAGLYAFARDFGQRAAMLASA